jgi:hypothetical protein
MPPPVKARYLFMSDGSVPLHRYPGLQVRLACQACPRTGQFGKAALMERVGPDESLVTLRHKIAEGWGCESARAIMAGRSPPGSLRCGVYYPELFQGGDPL